MITSEIGLLEIPHVWAPASMTDLAKNIKTVQDPAVFPVDIPIHFIRGIKNRYDPQTAHMSDVGALDFMRGEESQIAGIFSLYEFELPVTVVVLSSHTKFIPIDEGRNILGSLTTISGQVYEAIIKETFIGKSIRKDDDFSDADYFADEVVDLAYDWVTRAGFLRTLLMPRFLDVLLKTKWYERKLFVEAAIAAEDMKALDQFPSFNFPVRSHFILVGSKPRCSIYAYMLKRKMQVAKDILSITDTDEIDLLSIKGVLHLAKKAGLL
jgi:2-dehydro-3-deoxygalactonokinase